MRSIREFYARHAWAFYLASVVLSLGGGGIAVKTIGEFAALDRWWALSLFAVVSGGLLLGLQYLPPGNRSSSTLGTWESALELPNTQTMVLNLRSKTGPQMIRGLACDVRGPMSGVPARAVIDKTGHTQLEHVHYPENFAPTGLRIREGPYEVTWYEADEDWKWRMIAQSTHDVRFADLT